MASVGIVFFFKTCWNYILLPYLNNELNVTMFDDSKLKRKIIQGVTIQIFNFLIGDASDFKIKLQFVLCEIGDVTINLIIYLLIYFRVQSSEGDQTFNVRK